MKKKDEIKVCLVGSSGGHLTHLYMLKPFWKDKNRFWVTFDKEDARSLLEGEKVYPCYFPTNRSIKALIKNTKIAWDVLHKEKPDLIISCGAAVAVPFFYIGKMMGAKLVYIEVFDRIDKPTMTGKMVYALSIQCEKKDIDKKNDSWLETQWNRVKGKILGRNLRRVFYEFRNSTGLNSVNGDEHIQNVKNLCDYQSKFTGKRWLDEFDWISFLNER